MKNNCRMHQIDRGNPCDKIERDCRLSLVSKDYLCRFFAILEEMMKGMTESKLTNSISHNFIVQMIPHHQAAVEMSRNLLRYTTCIPLQNIALQIIEEQTKSIETMRQSLDCCSEVLNACQDAALYERRVSQIMKTMFHDMGHSPMSNQLNSNFIYEMIPHHQGAIQMSENAFRYDICPELNPILSSIITSQKRGIMQMQRLLCDKHCLSFL